ncbi:MAG: FixH family protein [Anaerolineae bacterium]|nr:FixH family protein [Anaerolineae bacterium]
MTMNFEVEPNPPAVGPSHLTVLLTDDSGLPIDGANIDIKADMNHDGMQPLRAKTKTGADGAYGMPFKWTMAGNWTVTVTAALPDGQVAERQFDFAVEEAMEMEPAEHAHSDHSHPKRLPNGDAVVRIISPEDGASFETGSDVTIEIETESFKLGEEGNHWHLYVDDQPGRMIMGEINDAILRNLEPGHHHISAYLSVGSHEDLEEGAAIAITVIDPGQEEDVSMNMENHEGEHHHN